MNILGMKAVSIKVMSRDSLLSSLTSSSGTPRRVSDSALVCDLAGALFCPTSTTLRDPLCMRVSAFSLLSYKGLAKPNNPAKQPAFDISLAHALHEYTKMKI